MLIPDEFGGLLVARNREGWMRQNARKLKMSKTVSGGRWQERWQSAGGPGGRSRIEKESRCNKLEIKGFGQFSQSSQSL